MKLKVRSTSVFVLSAAAAGVMTACSFAADPSSTESSSSSNEALNTVVSCQNANRGCEAASKTPSDLASCRRELQSCLMSLLPTGGLPPVPPELDAGFPPRPPRPTLPDAGFPGRPVRGFDAGFPVVPPVTPPPITLPDAGMPPQRACLEDLQTCLFSKTDPATCATDVRTCLTAAVAAQCDDQEKGCLARKIPQAVCDAQRKDCH